MNFESVTVARVSTNQTNRLCEVKEHSARLTGNVTGNLLASVRDLTVSEPECGQLDIRMVLSQKDVDIPNNILH